MNLQHIRFQKQFPEVNLALENEQYLDPSTRLLFQGWSKCAETLREDNVTIYFSPTYGWCLENIDGTGVSHPEFNEEGEALEWAEGQGFVVIK